MPAGKRRPTTEVPSLVCLEGPLAYARQEAEKFVRASFDAAYGAAVSQFLPYLMTLRHDSGRLLAVLGMRCASESSLYLEKYLDGPVEQLLCAATSAPVQRALLVEVGNFAVGAAGGGRWLITALTAFLYSAGKTWAVFTCGPALQNAFRRLGIGLVVLAPADPMRLDEKERSRWGSYYAQRPLVMAADVGQSYHVLAALFERECALNSLWRGALQAGRLAA